jgi:hypothetical protein
MSGVEDFWDLSIPKLGSITDQRTAHRELSRQVQAVAHCQFNDAYAFGGQAVSYSSERVMACRLREGPPHWNTSSHSNA